MQNLVSFLFLVRWLCLSCHIRNEFCLENGQMFQMIFFIGYPSNDIYFYKFITD